LVTVKYKEVSHKYNAICQQAGDKSAERKEKERKEKKKKRLCW
jgi:hypothetical protein